MDIHNQTDIIRGVRLYVHESLSPSSQSVENSTNATYYIIVDNLGNVPDTFKLSISSADNPEILSLDKINVSLGAGEISALHAENSNAGFDISAWICSQAVILVFVIMMGIMLFNMQPLLSMTPMV